MTAVAVAERAAGYDPVLFRPAGPWLMAQGWQHLLFAHWPLPPGVLEPHVPAGLELDTYGGQAWLGVTPFHLAPLRMHGLPSLPGLAQFHEVNVRTYVRGGGLPGVLFLSLDADNLPAVIGSRVAYRLPYYPARMAQRVGAGQVCFASVRDPAGPFAELHISYRTASAVYQAAPGSLAHWLTARYRLFTRDGDGRLMRGEIRHRPWPLQDAHATIRRNTMALSHGIHLPPSAPLLHYSRGVTAYIWPLQEAA